MRDVPEQTAGAFSAPDLRATANEVIKAVSPRCLRSESAAQAAEPLAQAITQSPPEAEQFFLAGGHVLTGLLRRSLEPIDLRVPVDEQTVVLQDLLVARRGANGLFRG